MSDISQIKINNTNYNIKAVSLNSSSVGSATKGVYINASGIPVAMTYSLGADVPANAVFTSKAGAENGTELSLVTTGDKYRWDQGGGDVKFSVVNGEPCITYTTT